MGVCSQVSRTFPWAPLVSADPSALRGATGSRLAGLIADRGGVADMLKHPRRHFVLRRVAEVDMIGATSPEHRPGVYLEDFLRPATDIALRTARVLPDLVQAQERLESWRFTLGAVQRAGVGSVSAPALGQRIHVARSKPRSL